MKRLRAIALLPLLFLAAPAPAEAPFTPISTAAYPQAKPALWAVRDADTTIYLFGTVHALPPGLIWYKGAVKTAFDASGELVIEIVDGDEQAQTKLMLEKAIDPDGPALTAKLGDKAAAFRARLETLGLSADDFEALEPWFAANLLVVNAAQKLGLNTGSGVETVLIDKARIAKKPVGEIESFATQMEMFDTLPEAVQIENLNMTVRDLPQTGPVLDTLMRAWISGDDATIAKTTDEEMDVLPLFREALVTRRNANWARWIKARLEKPGTTFLAVGAAHLAGRDSVQAQLGMLGLKTERVN